MAKCILAELIENLPPELGDRLKSIMSKDDTTPVENQTKAVRVRLEKIAEVKDTDGWQTYAKEIKHVDGKHTDYYGAMEKVISKLVSPTVVKDVSGLMLESVFSGDLKKLIPGEYDTATNTVYIAEKPSVAETEYAVNEGLEYIALELYKVDAATTDEKMKIIAEFVDMNKAKVLANVLESVEKVNGTHSLVHELVHAGAINFMRENKDHPATQRINDLYEEAMAQKDTVQRLAASTDVVSTYWQKNVDEFLAEALSNPGLIYALSNIKTESKEKLSKGMFREIVETLIDMLGLTKKTADNVLEFTMDGFAAIMEAQAVKNNVLIDADLAITVKTQGTTGTIHLKDRAKVEAKYLEKLENC